MIALVLGVIAASTAAGIEGEGVGLDVGEHRGRAGERRRSCAVAAKVNDGTMTSSPGADAGGEEGRGAARTCRS